MRDFASAGLMPAWSTYRPLPRLLGRVREGALAASLSHGVGPLRCPPQQAGEGSVCRAYRRRPKHCFAADP